ncbi:cytochrome P450 family protein [Lacunimicrobium album]
MDATQMSEMNSRDAAGNGLPLPVTRTSMQSFADDPVAMMRKLKAEHGDVACIEDEQAKAFFVFHPKWNQFLLSQPQLFHSRFFAIRGSRRSAQRKLTEGLLSMNDDQHRRHRRMVKEPFSRKSIGSYSSTIQTLTSELLAGWQVGKTVDINSEMTHYMLRLTSALLFGIDHPEKAYAIGEKIDTWVRYNHRLGPMAFGSHPDLASEYEDMLAYGEELEDMIREFITMKRDQLASRGDGPAEDVLSLLLAAHDAEGEINEDQLVGHVTLLFAAAHLTTAHTFTWTHMLLSQHPDVATSLLQEIETTLGSSVPEMSDFARLPLLDRVLKESMRIMPASSYSQRTNVAPVDLGPFKLAPGSAIIFSQFMTHHREDFYPEPERFLPERWLTCSPPPYAYLPFGAGPRMCVGAGLAMQILMTAMPMIMQKFRLSLIADTPIEAKVISTMLNPMLPVMMSINEQDGAYSEVNVKGNIHSLVEFPSRIGSRKKMVA